MFMASSTDSDDSSSSDSDDLVFYDANESLSTSEASGHSSLQEEPRRKISSQKSNHYNISLTKIQLHDIELRDKLQRLRSHEKSSTPNNPNSHEFSTLPVRSGGLRAVKKLSSSTSESNLIDLNTIDRITKYGEIYPNSKKLNDDEILRQPIVRNLDNGKYIPLIDANPMTQTILERVHANDSLSPTKRPSIFNSNTNLRKNSDVTKSDFNLSRTVHNDDNDSSSTVSSHSSQTTDASSVNSKSSNATSQSSTKVRKQLSKLILKNLLRRKKPKSQLPKEIDEDDEIFLINDGSNGDLKYKASRYLKEQAQFDKTQLLQTIVNAHDGPIWSMKFSPDGHLLATGGQDSLVKIWVLRSTQIYFNDFSHLITNSTTQQNEILTTRFQEFHQQILSETQPSTTINTKLGLNENQGPLFSKPFCELHGHQASVVDVAWSKSLFILSSSMDKTVRLWHLSRSECLCFFRHIDFVSAIAFHPRDDRYFVSASLDGHVRLWNIPDKRVVHWTPLPPQVSSQISAANANLITAVNFCDDGRKVTVGTFDGRFLIYSNSLEYETVMNIGEKDASRSHRSRKTRRKPHKITGIESMNSNNSKVLITSNDSRIRLYDIRTKEIERKYRGSSNQSSQIRATFSHDDRYIISGSEDSWFYIWRTEPNHLSTNSILTRKQRKHFSRAFERIRVHNNMVTSAIFAPNPLSIMNDLHSSLNSSLTNVNNRLRTSGMHSSDNSIYVMITADSKGQLKLLANRYHR